MSDMNAMVQVVQLPVITESLEERAAEVTRWTEEMASLVCTEETLPAVKAKRAAFRAEFEALEKARKSIKETVMAPYAEFEAKYKALITDAYMRADGAAKGKIEAVETALRDERFNEIKAYFTEKCASLGIDFLKLEDAGIKVTRSASRKSLTDAVDKFTGQIKRELVVIDTLEDRDEVLCEYRRNGYRLDCAVSEVRERKEFIKKQSEQEEAATSGPPRPEPEKEGAKNTEAPETLRPAEEIVRLTFTVEGTRDELRALKAFLADGGYTVNGERMRRL